jgi:hypothetical protein
MKKTEAKKSRATVPLKRSLGVVNKFCFMVTAEVPATVLGIKIARKTFPLHLHRQIRYVHRVLDRVGDPKVLNRYW